MESGKIIVCLSSAHSPTRGRVSRVEITTSGSTSSSTEQVFDTLVRDSVTEVFNGVLGKIGGQALFDAIERSASLEIKDFSGRPDLLDQALKVHLGRAAKVLERKILRTLAGKTAAGTLPLETDRFDFASEIENVRKQFLKRKQAANHPQMLE